MAVENIKERRRYPQRSRIIKEWEFEDPIPTQIYDVGDLKKFFEIYRQFVPFAGTNIHSAHSMCLLLQTMAGLNTQGACINSISRFAFGGPLQIARKTDPVFDLGEAAEVSQAEKMAFYEFMSLFRWYDVGGNSLDLRDFSRHVFFDYKATGNAYVEIVQSEVAGQRMQSATIHNPPHCLYLATDPGEQRYIAVSPKWDELYISQNSPRILPLFPAFDVHEDGTRRSILHLKSGNFPWYGRPDSSGSFLYQYREMQDANYLIKTARGSYVGFVAIEVEEDDPEFDRELSDQAREDGYENYQHRLEENFTMKGKDPTGIMFMTRPYGSRPVTIETVQPNVNHEWYEATDQINRRHVIMSHQWSERLLGQSVASGLSTNVFRDELATKVDVVEDNRMPISVAVNEVIFSGVQFMERPEFEDKSIAFSSPTFDNESDNSMGGGEVGSGE